MSTHCERVIGEVAKGIAVTHSVEAVLDYRKGYPPVVNTAASVVRAVEAAAVSVGPDHVETGIAPSLGCEDFAYMIRAVGGAYVWIGNGEAGPGEGLHGDHYVFNDAIVPIGLSYWTNLVEQTLPANSEL